MHSHEKLSKTPRVGARKAFVYPHKKLPQTRSHHDTLQYHVLAREATKEEYVYRYIRHAHAHARSSTRSSRALVGGVSLAEEEVAEEATEVRVVGLVVEAQTPAVDEVRCELRYSDTTRTGTGTRTRKIYTSDKSYTCKLRLGNTRRTGTGTQKILAGKQTQNVASSHHIRPKKKLFRSLNPHSFLRFMQLERYAYRTFRRQKIHLRTPPQ